MTQKKYSPEEIAKSLRVCIEARGGSASKCHLCALHGGFFECDCFDELNEQAADMIEAQAKRIGELEAELAKLREENRWIPVEERLPDLDDGPTLLDGEMAAVQVLALFPDTKKSTCLYFDGEDFFDYTGDELIPYRVAHWKPLPDGLAKEGV